MQQDLSFHVLLSPADGATIIERKWGECFAFSGRRMRFSSLKGAAVVPQGYALVYTPRTLTDVAVVEEIVKAALAYGLSG